jgi:hypothetical protein
MGEAPSLSPQTTPTSTGFPSNFQAQQHPAPVYFDSTGQPVAATKMSTVGTASATASYLGEDRDDVRGMDQDEDMLSMDTNYREAESVTSMGQDQMDEDLDALATQSVGGYEDRMSDDGSASLVAFGEGAGSTVSGPIYHRRPLPSIVAQGSGAGGVWTLERSNSGRSDGISGRRDKDSSAASGFGGDTPVSAAALQERRDARMIDGVAGIPDEEMYVDTTTRGPAPVAQINPLQHPHQQPQQQPQDGGYSTESREAAELILRERLDHGEAKAGLPTLSSPGIDGERLGKFYFEDKK